MKKAKKVKKSSSVNTEAFDIEEFMSSVNSELGEGTLVRANHANLSVKWISTGCVAIDLATGGGIPENRITEIFGPESAGKTTLSLKSIAEFQKVYPNGIAVFVDLERTFDRNYAERLGVNCNKLILSVPDSGEQAINVISKCCGNNTDVFIVLDSIAALVPSAEQEALAEQQFMGQQPRLVNRLMRIATSRMKKQLIDSKAPSTTLIVLNQLREKIGVMFGSPEVTPGGKGKNFFAGLRLRIFSSESKSNRIGAVVTRHGVKRNILYGRKITYSVIKNKCGGTPFEEGECDFYIKDYKGFNAFEYDNVSVLVNTAMFYGIIDTSGKRFEYTNGIKTVDGGKLHIFLTALKDPKNKGVYQSLYKEVMERVRSESLNPGAEDEEDEEDED